MSDSLREQMLQAGFKETKKARPKNAKSNAGKNKKGAGAHAKNHNTNKQGNNQPSTMERENIAQREAVAERKRVKAEIKTIIDGCKVENTKGEMAHGYLVGKRIKQMFVNEELKNKLVSGELVITRLNGSTFLIPSAEGEKVKKLNPDWVVITPTADGANDIDDDYADFQVPDDLQW